MIAAGSAPYFALLEPGDEVAPFTLDAIAGRLDENPEIDLLYSDEDRVTKTGRRVRPILKPSWSPTLLEHRDYIGRLAIIHRRNLAILDGSVAATVSRFQWDALGRLDCDPARIVRLPGFLCHRPDEPNHESAKRPRVEPAPWAAEKAPLVSLIVPTRDNPRMIRNCVDGLLQKTEYPNREIILVDNGSANSETLALYARWLREERIRVVPFDRPFNYSAACNLGARHARGDLLLFLNNDTRVIDRRWLDELVRWALRPKVGVVGAKLLYPSGRLQHVGVSLAGPAMNLHPYRGMPEGFRGLFGSTDEPRDLLAVTGACQLTRREVFEEIGGFDEAYDLCYSDLAFCLSARRLGYRVIVAPAARLIHCECRTRTVMSGTEIRDGRMFAESLRQAELDEDPYLHPFVSLRHDAPTLRSGAEAVPTIAWRAWLDLPKRPSRRAG